MKYITYLSSLFILMTLSACQSSLNINKTHQAKAQDERIQYVIIHYTAADLERSLYLLTTQQVSSHYLINSSPVTVYQLVDESKRAWHAGLSYWQGRTSLNSSSIGIELINQGYVDTKTGKRQWFPYPEQQIDALVTLLKNIKNHYNINPEYILGHNEIAPQRKKDPGPLFPWRRLAVENLILWPDEKVVAIKENAFKQKGLPSVQWFQKSLATIGYDTPLSGTLDEETMNVISVFQMKYQQDHFNGKPTFKTAALIETILEKKFAILQ